MVSGKYIFSGDNDQTPSYQYDASAATGLKGTSDKIKQHFFGCMSERGAEMMREDMEALGKVKMKDVEIAQQEIIALVRKLEPEGVVSLKGAVGGGDQYVD